LTTAEGKISTLETNTAGYGTRLTTVETDISGLKTRMSGAEEDISTVSGNVSDLSSSVTTNTNNIRTANTNIASLQTRMTAAENAIDAIDTSSTSTFEARISALEAQMSDVQSFMINGFDSEDITDQITLTKSSGNFTLDTYQCIRNGKVYHLHFKYTTTAAISVGSNVGDLYITGVKGPKEFIAQAMYNGDRIMVTGLTGSGRIIIRNGVNTLSSGATCDCSLIWIPAPETENSTASTNSITDYEEEVTM